MSEQDTVTAAEASEQSLAQSVNELETLTQKALEMDGEARADLVEQIKAKCEDEGLSSDETENLLEEIGLVQEAKVETKEKAKTTKEAEDEDSDDDDEEDDEEMDEAADVTPPQDGVDLDAADPKGPVAKKRKGDKTGSESSGAVKEIAFPKTKAAAMAAVYEKLGKMRKADMLSQYESILKSLDVEKIDEVKEQKVDVSDDVDALVEGEELSEEFKQKAATIFEAAVQAKVNSEILKRHQELEEENEKLIQEQVSEYKQEMVDQIDKYINYVSEQWLSENKLAVEQGVRTEITEGFITGMKNLFEEHYITIPEDKVDVVDDLFAKVEDLEKQLNEEIQKSVDLNKEVLQYKKEKIVGDLTSNLSNTQAEKVKDLAEGVEAEDVETFEKKVETIKENYFPTNTATATQIAEEVEPENEVSEEDTTTEDHGDMNKYMSAISRQVK